jgi:hypothetical protein
MSDWESADPTLTAELALQREVIATQRVRLSQLRASGDVSSSTFRSIQHDLDLDEERLSSEGAILDERNTTHEI